MQFAFAVRNRAAGTSRVVAQGVPLPVSLQPLLAVMPGPVACTEGLAQTTSERLKCLTAGEVLPWYWPLCRNSASAPRCALSLLVPCVDWTERNHAFRVRPSSVVRPSLPQAASSLFCSNVQPPPPLLLCGQPISAHPLSSATALSSGITASPSAMPLVVWTAALPLIGYIVYTTYTHRARIKRLQKAGYVSLLTKCLKTWLT